MSLLYCTGFDSFSTDADMQAEGWIGDWTYVSISTTLGRRGSQALRLGTTATYTAKIGIPAATTVIAGVAFYVVNGFNLAAYTSILNFIESAVTHVSIRLTPTGNLQIAAGGSVVFTSPSQVFFVNTWHYIEAKVFTDNTTGYVIVKVDGVEIANLTGIDTNNVGTPNINAVGLVACALGDYTYFDDLYICDNSGSYNNDFLGNVRVDYLPADANGAVNEWSRLSGSNNYEMVDDTTPDGDTTYTYSGTIGDQELYGCAALPHSPANIFGVKEIVVARKTGAEYVYHKPLLRSGSTIYTATDQGLSETYTVKTNIREVDPDTASPWTAGAVNAAQVGSEVA